MSSSFLYFATVRRAILIPRFPRASAIFWSDSRLPGSCSSIISLMIAFTPSLENREPDEPAPEIEFTYNVAFRRHYQFPNNDAVGYGRSICDAVQRGDAYSVVVADVRTAITPNDEESVNYLISNAVDILCPAQI